jgi:hypothetical protein
MKKFSPPATPTHARQRARMGGARSGKPVLPYGETTWNISLRSSATALTSTVSVLPGGSRRTPDPELLLLAHPVERAQTRVQLGVPPGR